MSDSPVNLSRGLPETVLPAAPHAWREELETALAEREPAARLAALQGVAARRPRFLDAWAALAGNATSPVESYAYARVGYHRGLDALRGAGWRGTGYVRFVHPTNRGFLRCLGALRAAAAAIGEADEEDRCRLFLVQLDPTWPDWDPSPVEARP